MSPTTTRHRAPRLVLFDVDGTLLSCGPQVRPWFAAALAEVFGDLIDRGIGEILDGYDFAGRTDPQITLDLMAAAGLSRGEVERRLPQMRDAFLGRLEKGLERRRMRLLPAVVESLEALGRQPRVTVGLLTGNWERGARAKLGRLDLDGYFTFGAFGDDGVERSDLVPVALERARRQAGRSFSPAETLIIGDSVHDVTCGRAHGVPVLAVATGTTPAAALARAGADWVASNLAAARSVLFS